MGEGCNGTELGEPPALSSSWWASGGRRGRVEIGDRSDTVGARLGAGSEWAGRDRGLKAFLLEPITTPYGHHRVGVS